MWQGALSSGSGIVSSLEWEPGEEAVGTELSDQGLPSDTLLFSLKASDASYFGNFYNVVYPSPAYLLHESCDGFYLPFASP